MNDVELQALRDIINLALSNADPDYIEHHTIEKYGEGPWEEHCHLVDLPHPMLQKKLAAISLNGYEVKKLTDIKTEQIKWLWYGRIARGILTMLDGMPDVGKSTLWVLIAAYITTGRRLPGHRGRSPRPGNVMVFAQEDSASVIKARILAAGGDPDRIIVVGTRKDEEGMDRSFNLVTADNMRELRRMFEEHRPAMAVFDPIMGYIGGIKSGIDNEVRDSLQPLVSLLEELQVAGFALRHANKDTRNTNAMSRGGGSVAFGALARCVMVAGTKLDPTSAPLDTEDEEASTVTPRQFFLAMAKCNMIPDKDKETFSYRMESAQVEGVDTSYVVFGPKSRLTANDLYREEKSEEKGESRLEAAHRIVTHLLATYGATTRQEAEFWCAAEDVSPTTLKRALAKMDLKEERLGSKSRLAYVKWQATHKVTTAQKRAAQRRANNLPKRKPPEQPS